MAHGYKTLHHWNQWLFQAALGKPLLEAEAEIISQMLEKHYGKHALLLGVPSQHILIKSTHLPCCTIATPIIDHSNEAPYVESDFRDLPFMTGSLDLVVLPHTLEMMEHPRQLLAEACRVVKPEGLIVISGFNPYSLWGLKKKYRKKGAGVPWSNHFIYSGKIKNWLELHDFKLEEQKYAVYGLPIQHPKLNQRLRFWEMISRRCFSKIGGVYVMLARAKVLQLTPIRAKWKQQLGNVRISTTMTGI